MPPPQILNVPTSGARRKKIKLLSTLMSVVPPTAGLPTLTVGFRIPRNPPRRWRGRGLSPPIGELHATPKLVCLPNVNEYPYTVKFTTISEEAIALKKIVTKVVLVTCRVIFARARAARRAVWQRQYPAIPLQRSSELAVSYWGEQLALLVVLVWDFRSALQ